ncbi:uncharacterized protein LOC100274906 [Zea mays]|uniref:Uncharacterized protein n=1 Tax=Zea mays TaxID=4577 RepID=B6SLA6_MAIZE|nr:uncharacterized protein LOC100274906 [Zea mays]ACG25639.1 hypothetical protein [Zea mays]|eukprot:NP_001142631.1 uncharacterized protein LOC100274906 [Zea mays]
MPERFWSKKITGVHITLMSYNCVLAMPTLNRATAVTVTVKAELLTSAPLMKAMAIDPRDTDTVASTVATLPRVCHPAMSDVAFFFRSALVQIDAGVTTVLLSTSTRMVLYHTAARWLVLLAARVKVRFAPPLPTNRWLLGLVTEKKMRAGLSRTEKTVTTTATARIAIRAARM